mgnify:FL=1
MDFELLDTTPIVAKPTMFNQEDRQWVMEANRVLCEVRV